MTTIRPATHADIPTILEFWATATTEPSSTDDAEAVGALIRTNPGALLLAVEEERVVGSVIAGWDGWRAGMYRLAVASERRRNGIGTDLVREGERRLLALGARRLHLIVASDEETAQGFWIAAGYEPTDQTRFVKNV
jgi:ribosomal protein S18 acetylase RimI-like enzyme